MDNEPIDRESEEWKRRQKEILEEIEDKVLNGPGWFAIAVFPTEKHQNPPFVYTVGMAENDMPELVICSFDPAISQSVISSTIERMKETGVRWEDVPETGLRLKGVLQGDFEILLRHVDGTRSKEAGVEFNMAFAFEQRRGRNPWPMEVLQIILPDPKGFFPEDQSYDWEEQVRLYE